jgi:hypothetical protein
MQDLYSEMNVTLAQISEKSSGTQATVMTISDRLLEQALGKALPETRRQEDSANLGQDFVERLAENLAPLLGNGSERSNPTVAPPPSNRGFPRRSSTDEEDARITRYLSSFPGPDELRAIVQTLERLDDEELGDLLTLADDEVKSRRPGGGLAPGLRVFFPWTPKYCGVLRPEMSAQTN